MNGERIVAGIFSGAGALLLLYQGNVEAGIAILAAMMGFFIGEKNGQRNKKEEPEY